MRPEILMESEVAVVTERSVTAKGGVESVETAVAAGQLQHVDITDV